MRRFTFHAWRRVAAWTQAVLMVALVLVSVPISFVSIANSLDVLTLLTGAKEASALKR